MEVADAAEREVVGVGRGRESRIGELRRGGKGLVRSRRKEVRERGESQGEKERRRTERTFNLTPPRCCQIHDRVNAIQAKK